MFWLTLDRHRYLARWSAVGCDQADQGSAGAGEVAGNAEAVEARRPGVDLAAIATGHKCRLTATFDPYGVRTVIHVAVCAYVPR
jgi:hypothetical protein